MREGEGVMPVVTIRGQMGSGVTEIGKLVAKRLGTEYVDREILAEVAARLGHQEEKIETKEMPAGTFMEKIYEALRLGAPAVPGVGGVGVPSVVLPTWETPIDDPNYLAQLVSVIKELAAVGSIVIQGRGSQFILKDYPGAFHVFVVAPLSVRIDRVMNSQKLDKKAAGQEINRYDSSRHEFIKRYFKAELEDPIHYDLVINTGHIDYENAASIILDTISLRQ
jgi:cytidylate kinase